MKTLYRETQQQEVGESDLINPRRALITGGNGYVGSVLIKRLLSEGIEVHASAHHRRDHLNTHLPASQIHSSNNRDSFLSDLVLGLQPEMIFHLASIYVESNNLTDLMTMVETNIRLGTSLLHGASQCESKPVFVNTGTYWQFTDADTYTPNTFYAATKQAFHDIMLYFSRCQGLRAMTLILYDSFGQDDTRPKLWTKLANAPAGCQFPVTEGKQFMELVHVEDIAQAFVHAADMLLAGKGLDRTFAIRSELPHTLRETLEQWRIEAGLDFTFAWGSVQYHPNQVFEPWQGERLPGWYPRININQAVVDWLRTTRRESIERS